MPSPHCGAAQLKLHVALFFPAVSHTSSVWSLTTLSPQNSTTQAPRGDVLPLQPSPLTSLPSSHCSPGSSRPLPHFSSRQSKQPSPFTVLPSSHSSPGSTTPLPQCSNRQSAEQPFVTDGGSHCSG